MSSAIKVRRALFTVSDKSKIVELAQTLHSTGTEIVATGRTAKVLEEAGVPITPIEKVSGSPEAFQGRMKTLSFPVCSGILYRRGDAQDELDLKNLKIPAVDCVVVNFYPFEQALASAKSKEELIEEIDIGGPTLVRAAAKNFNHVLVLTDPAQYDEVISELKSSQTVSLELREKCRKRAWEKIARYDEVIAQVFGEGETLSLRYGENPHQKAKLVFDPDGPVAWPGGKNPPLTPNELSYNNILDFTAAYQLAGDLLKIAPESTGVVVIKHNNPCGVAMVPVQGGDLESAQRTALLQAWEGDPISAFGGVLVFTHTLQISSAEWLAERFIELVAAPNLDATRGSLELLLSKRKKLKAVSIRAFHQEAPEVIATVPGGKLIQDPDSGLQHENFRSVTEKKWPAEKQKLALFGIAVTRSLKSNAIALVRERDGGFQLLGAGQGQPNRIDALKLLAIPRAQGVLRQSGGRLEECVMISDAFFPFRDTVDAAYASGIRWIVQPGGSLKDQESIDACNEGGVAMAFTGTRHFRH